MARLIDDLRRVGPTMPWFVSPEKRATWATDAAQLLAFIRDPIIPVILIDNVATYYYEGTDQEQWNLNEHFPNLAPPYELFWVEHRFPRKIHSAQEGDRDLSGICPNGRNGWLIFGTAAENLKGADIPANMRWALTCEQFVDFGFRRDEITGPNGCIHLAIDADGRMIDCPYMRSYAPPGADEMMRSHMGWLHPALLAISFLHCKNVRVEDNPVPAKLARRFRERHGFNPAVHKTLVIEPLKEILRREGRSGEVGLAKAMHICRGHFADYTQGKGLFGKYHGKYWIPSTVRGTKGKAAPAREIEIKV